MMSTCVDVTKLVQKEWCECEQTKHKYVKDYLQSFTTRCNINQRDLAQKNQTNRSTTSAALSLEYYCSFNCMESA